MSEELRTMIQEEFANCNSLEKVIETYKEISIETNKQMQFMIKDTDWKN